MAATTTVTRNQHRRQARIDERRKLPTPVYYSPALMDATLESAVRLCLENLFPSAAGNDYFKDCQEAACIQSPPLSLASPDVKNRMIALAREQSLRARTCAITFIIKWDVLAAYCNLCNQIIWQCI